MSFGATLVAIVAILAWASLRHRRYAAPREDQAGAEVLANAALVREVAGLRERVEVLERILTDRRDSSTSLAREIESLRD